MVRSAAVSARETAPAEVHEAVAQPGRPLDSSIRAYMEARFAHDFGRVRVHDDDAAAASARAVNARAYTVGRHVVFGDGGFAPHTEAGRRVLAHELAHVVEDGGRSGSGSIALGARFDPAELRAERAAEAVARGLDAPSYGVQFRGSPILRRLEVVEEASGPTPIAIGGTTFEEAAATFAYQLGRHKDQLKNELGGLTPEQSAIVVVNGGVIRLFNGTGASAATLVFHAKRPLDLPTGVLLPEAGPDPLLHKLFSDENGKWLQANDTIKGGVNFTADIVEQQDFDDAIRKFEYAFYVVPNVDVDPAQTTAQVEEDKNRPIPEPQPDFLKFDARAVADLPAWPAGVVAVTPQVTSVGSIGTFACQVDKYDPWQNTLANVADNLQPMNFRWEVLKLDDKLSVVGKRVATRVQGVKGHFEQRERHLEDDRKVRIGDEPRSVAKDVMFKAIDAQYHAPRATLAYTGEVALTLIHAIAGQPGSPNLQDYIDVPFDQPGNYFVRCLATPVAGADAKHRRATSVAGVTVSVFDIKELATDALPTVDEESKQSAARLSTATSGLEELKAIKASGNIDLKDHPMIDAELAVAELRVERNRRLQKGVGDESAVLSANLDYYRALIAVLIGPPPPRIDPKAPNQAKLREGLAAALKDDKEEEARLAGQVQRAAGRLGGATRTNMFKATFIDDSTGVKQDLLFSVGERAYVARDVLEVRIADVTDEKGRVFTGAADGMLGAGRHDAWQLAMRDLRRNLGRGRGYIAWRAPEPYASLSDGIDNPLQLQVGELDQIKETVDDAAHAATLVAILAAPLTEGASLGVLAVLAPIQAASSLYNIVNRAFYADLHVDRDSILDFINIATLGLGKVATIKQVSIVAGSAGVAVRWLDKGMYVVIAVSTFQDLMKDDPNEDPRAARRRKLAALISALETALIPVAHGMFPELGHAAPGPPELKSGDVKDTQGRLADDRTPVVAEKVVRPGDEQQPDRAERKSRADEAAGSSPKGAASATTVPPELLAVLPADVQKNAPPQINASLSVDTVRIVYTADLETGVLTEMHMEIGPGTRPEFVKAHVETARTMARYMGLTGRIRIVLEQLAGYITRNNARPGSRAWEARLELVKLNRLIKARADLYQDATPRGKEQLRAELDSLQAQFAAHARDVDLFGREGTGIVAAEGKSGGEAERLRLGYEEAPEGYYWYFKPPGKPEVRSKSGADFKPKRYNETKRAFEPAPERGTSERLPKDASEHNALDELGAFEQMADPRTGELTAGSGFRRFIDVLIAEKIIDKPQDLFDPAKRGDKKARIKPGGLTYDYVRGNLKEPFKAQLLERVSDPARLKRLASYRDVLAATKDSAQALRAASHQEFMRVSEGLPSADRGSFGELWYKQQFAPAAERVSISKAEAARQGVDLARDRVLDQLEAKGATGKAREIKNIAGELGTDSKRQIEDDAALLGKNITLGEGRSARQIKIDAFDLVFPDPQGAFKNRVWLESFLMEQKGNNVSVEIHNDSGQIGRVTPESRAWLTNGGLENWLAGKGPGPGAK